MTERYIDIHEVSRKVDLSTKSIRRKVKKRQFPAPFRWGGGWRWLESEIDRWMLVNAIENRIDPDEIEDDGAELRGQSGTSLSGVDSGASKKK